MLFVFTEESDSGSENWNKVSRMELGSSCLNVVSLAVFALAFLIGQTVILVSWSFVCSRKRKNSLIENDSVYGSSNQWSVRSSMPPVAVPSKNYSAYPDSNMLYTCSVPSRQNASFIYS